MTATNTIEPDEYRSLIEKFVQLGPNDWPKFQNYPKDIHSKGIVETETQNKANERIEIANKE